MGCLHKTKYEFQLPTALRVFTFGFSQTGLIKSSLSFKTYQQTRCHGPALTGTVWHPPQKFECAPFYNG
jgi:hypothetical protein